MSPGTRKNRIGTASTTEQRPDRPKTGPRGAKGGSLAAFVGVSPRDPRYLELSDGTPYVPIGLNLISPGWDDGTEAGLAQMEGGVVRLPVFSRSIVVRLAAR